MCADYSLDSVKLILEVASRGLAKSDGEYMSTVQIILSVWRQPVDRQLYNQCTAPTAVIFTYDLTRSYLWVLIYSRLILHLWAYLWCATGGSLDVTTTLETKYICGVRLVVH